MAALVADWVRFSSRAAWVTCCFSATATNIRSCSSVMILLLQEFDQCQTESRDEKEGKGTQYSRPDSFRVELGDIGFQAHGGESYREQKSGEGNDRLAGFNGDIDDAVQTNDSYKAKNE